MQILEAYDLVGSFRAAAELAGCDKNTVRDHVQRRAAGFDPGASAPRASVTDAFRSKIEELVARSEGRIRADVAHDKLVAMGFAGSARTTRRAVAEAKVAYRAGRRRVYRPWIPEPGLWLQWDWGVGPTVAGRATQLWCAWLAWSRFRVVIATWDKTLATVLSCLDATLRRVGGAPTYVLTDNEATVTVDRVAGVAVRHPEVAAAGRHYGVTVATCVPADPESKGGSEATVRLAKADVVPTQANLRGDYASFAELQAACEQHCETVNHRVHRETGAVPADRLEHERQRLHPLPSQPYVAALGETRRVTRSSVISLGGVRYSVPHRLIDETVYVRRHGDEVVIAHHSRDGVAEVARHPVSTPGNPQIDPAHYPEQSTSKALEPDPWPRTAEEAAFLALGPGAAAWLTTAASHGTERLRAKMAEAVEFAAVYGHDPVDAALATAAEAGRFAEGDLAAILRHQRQRAGQPSSVVHINEAQSLQPGTARWKEVGL